MKISLGIITLDDEATIGRLLRSISAQKLSEIEIAEIIIVSGRQFPKRLIKGNIRLFMQKKRKGKYSAINLLLKHAKSKILMQCSGDIVLEENCVERLCLPLKDNKIGIAGCRPISMDNKRFPVSSILWDIHHQVSMMEPKFGEAIAFRKAGIKLPQTSVDEEMISMLITKKGFLKHYASDAIVFNNSPLSTKGYLMQRRRIYCGHLMLNKKHAYKVPSLDNIMLIKNLIKITHKFDLAPLASAIFLEFVARCLGYFDFFLGKENLAWPLKK